MYENGIKYTFLNVFLKEEAFDAFEEIYNGDSIRQGRLDKISNIITVLFLLILVFVLKLNVFLTFILVDILLSSLHTIYLYLLYKKDLNMSIDERKRYVKQLEYQVLFNNGTRFMEDDIKEFHIRKCNSYDKNYFHRTYHRENRILEGILDLEEKRLAELEKQEKEKAEQERGLSAIKNLNKSDEMFFNHLIEVSDKLKSLNKKKYVVIKDLSKNLNKLLKVLYLKPQLVCLISSSVHVYLDEVVRIITELDNSDMDNELLSDVIKELNTSIELSITKIQDIIDNDKDTDLLILLEQIKYLNSHENGGKEC